MYTKKIVAALSLVKAQTMVLSIEKIIVNIILFEMRVRFGSVLLIKKKKKERKKKKRN